MSDQSVSRQTSTTSVSSDPAKESKQEKLQESLQLLRSKINSAKTSFPFNQNYDFDDDFLTKFLKGKDLDVDATFNQIKGWFRMRKDHPELFCLPSEVKGVFDDNVFTLCPKRNSKTNQLVMFFRPGHWDPEKYSAQHIASAPVPFTEYVAMNPITQDFGMIEILDMRSVTFKQFWNFPASLHSMIADLTENALPLSFSKIHVVNEGKLVNTLWTVLRPFLSNDFRSRINFHGSDYKKLHEEIDRDLLPVELEGTRISEYKFAPEYIERLDQEIQALWDKYPV